MSDQAPDNVVSAEIVSIESRPLAAAPPVQIIRLAVPGGYGFNAGQYLEVCHPSGTRIPLSIASAPELLPELVLHYRSTPELTEAARMDELLASREALTIGPAAGNVQLLETDDRPLFLIAGGTGIAQALSLSNAQTMRYPEQSVRLLACSDSTGDFYFNDLLPDSSLFESVLIADPSRSGGNRGLQWIRKNAAVFSDQALRIVLSGSPGFVYAMTDTLNEIRVRSSAMESDVYAYAPR